MSLFQSNLRKQIRNLPKILNFVKIIHYYSKLFTGVLSNDPDVVETVDVHCAYLQTFLHQPGGIGSWILLTAFSFFVVRKSVAWLGFLHFFPVRWRRDKNRDQIGPYISNQIGFQLYTAKFISIVSVPYKFRSELHTTSSVTFDCAQQFLLELFFSESCERWRQGDCARSSAPFPGWRTAQAGVWLSNEKMSTLSVSGRPFQIDLFSSNFWWAIFLADEPRKRVFNGRIKKMSTLSVSKCRSFVFSRFRYSWFMISYVRWQPN